MKYQTNLKVSLSLLITFSFLLRIPSKGQSVGKTREHDTTFIYKIIPKNSVLSHPIIRSRQWSANESIIALFGYNNPGDPNEGFNKIWGHVYLPNSVGLYRDILFGPIEEDGGYPEVISVFFANADTDKFKELVVLCRYKQKHTDYDGEFFEVFIYDNPNKENKLNYLEKISESFFGCECTYSDGKKESAPFKNADSIRRKLLKMGFR